MQENQSFAHPNHTLRVNHGHFPQAQRMGMAVNYYVLKCRPVLTRSSPQVQHDHLQVLLEIDSGQRFWMTINIGNPADQIQYAINEQFQHPITTRILDQQLPQGFTKLTAQPGGIALDYIREKLVDFTQLHVPPPVGGSQPSLADMLTTQLTNAYRFTDARLFVFGSMFTDGIPYSSYHLAVGIHDIHMNQGSRGSHRGSNGIYQDGGLLIYYPTEKRWSATFLKFVSQATQTDNHGNPLAQK
jgi:uncharacterized protein YukJ